MLNKNSLLIVISRRISLKYCTHIFKGDASIIIYRLYTFIKQANIIEALRNGNLDLKNDEQNKNLSECHGFYIIF